MFQKDTYKIILRILLSLSMFGKYINLIDILAKYKNLS